jgi:hypothetical protein
VIWPIAGLLLGGLAGLLALPRIAYRIEHGRWRMPRDRWDVTEP